MRKTKRRELGTYEAATTTAAIQFVLLVLIESHPDKSALLGTFDDMLNEYDAIGRAAGGGIPSPLRDELHRYREQMAGTAE